jgi:DNA-binding SARP family transcriptional activator
VADLEIRVLGPVEALRAGIPLPLGGKTTITVLASLAIARGQVGSVDTLIDHVWGSNLPANPRAALHNGVSRLRLLLGESALQTLGWGYRLRVDDENLDVSRFCECLAGARKAASAHLDERAIAALDAAIALWRQPLLGNVSSQSLHHEFVPQMTERYLDAVELRAELCLRSGRHVALADELLEVARAHPLRERLAGLRMVALARAGRRADALIAYDSLRRSLREELGIDPSPSLQDLQAHIRRAEPRLDISLAGQSAAGFVGTR